MIYPILNNTSVGSPVQILERNVGLDPALGATSKGIRFFVGVGDTKFLLDQYGNLYYSATGGPKQSYYSPGKLEYLGEDRVTYDFKDRIHSIGSHIIYYDSYSGKVERINNTVLMYDSYTGKISSAGGVYFYYEYDYSLSEYVPKKVGDCCFYYDSGRLSKITYYTLPSSYSKEWAADVVRDGTMSIYYDYSGRINKLGSISIY